MGLPVPVLPLVIAGFRLRTSVDGGWLVFRGDPNTYHFSPDGETWTATEAPQASRSHLIEGDAIHTFYTVLVEPAPALSSTGLRGSCAGSWGN